MADYYYKIVFQKGDDLIAMAFDTKEEAEEAYTHFKNQDISYRRKVYKICRNQQK
jgi:hypothetical protein